MMAMTYKIAHAAGWDAGNKLMRELGLTAWNEDCLVRASEVHNALWPMEAIEAQLEANSQ